MQRAKVLGKRLTSTERDSAHAHLKQTRNTPVPLTVHTKKETSETEAERNKRAHTYMLRRRRRHEQIPAHNRKGKEKEIETKKEAETEKETEKEKEIEKEIDDLALQCVKEKKMFLANTIIEIDQTAIKYYLFYHNNAIPYPLEQQSVFLGVLPIKFHKIFHHNFNVYWHKHHITR